MARAKTVLSTIIYILFAAKAGVQNFCWLKTVRSSRPPASVLISTINFGFFTAIVFTGCVQAAQLEMYL
jgi:hypothetical protein